MNETGAAHTGTMRIDAPNESAQHQGSVDESSELSYFASVHPTSRHTSA